MGELGKAVEYTAAWHLSHPGQGPERYPKRAQPYKTRLDWLDQYLAERAAIARWNGE